jgi:phosphoribosylamine--glycine ligase
MNILLIGNGGREHAIARTIHLSTSTSKLYAYPGNPGIFTFAELTNLTSLDSQPLINYCLSRGIDLVVIGPEQPLADGISDILRQEGINVFGPSQKAARLESSKSIAKEFMLRHKIPTARFGKFSSENKDEAHSFIDASSLTIVLKADGLAAGKGVIIADNIRDAHDTVDSMFGGLFKEAGETIVIEEFLYGQEASILAVSDGKEFVTLASSQDHKRALDGDLGKNTGGMGAYAPAPLVTDDVLNQVKEKILKPAIEGMSAEGTPFVGCLYAGLMINRGEPKVVEFNVRFGDPETQAVLSVFDGDFAGLLYSAAIGNLDKSCIKNIADGFACCVILASQGYPDSYEKGFEISGIEEAEKSGAIVYHSGTKLNDGKLISNGGRVLGVTGNGSTLQLAISNAYEAVSKIRFENMNYRRDIGKKANL